MVNLADYVMELSILTFNKFYMKNYIRIWGCSLVVLGMFVMFGSGCGKGDKDDPGATDLIDNIDIDGNVYTTITIGAQVWMVENLKTTKYRNGDPIPNESANSAWKISKKGALCNYNNNEANGNRYGKLYNWYAVNDSRKLAPAGWHIPSDAEWNTLSNYLAANPGASGSVIKALAAKIDWATSAEDGAVGNDLTKNNASGFTGLPGGIRGLDGPSGVFGWLGTDGWWWSASSIESSFASARGMKNTAKGTLENGGFFKTDGLAVRCIKD
jgi:uncharacterized protein (TIGR02145 family)